MFALARLLAKRFVDKGLLGESWFVFRLRTEAVRVMVTSSQSSYRVFLGTSTPLLKSQVL